MTDDKSELFVAKQDANATAVDRGIITRNDLVHFVHPEGGYQPGQEWAARYYHIETPETQRCGEMYTYMLEGYSYGIARPLSVTWVGYLFAGASSQDNLLRQHHAQVVLPTDVPTLKASQYVGSNGHLYLLLGPISQYYNSFTLSYRSGSTGEIVTHDRTRYQVHMRADASPI